MNPCEAIAVRDLSKGRSLRGATLLAVEENEILRAVPDGSKVVALDESGALFSSLDLARWFEGEQNRGTKGVAFVIGGPDGIGPRILANADLKLSLGRMTWTHEMCRALLLEQIYRALCIIRNIPYHR